MKVISLHRERNIRLNVINFERKVILFQNEENRRGMAFIHEQIFKDSLEDLQDALNKDEKISILVTFIEINGEKKPYLVSIDYPSKQINPSKR